MSDIAYIMQVSSIPFPARRTLARLGRDLSVARRKRRISVSDMASRLFVSRDTVWRLEKGDPGVSIGTLATAAFILQKHEELAHLFSAGQDSIGLDLDEERLPKRITRKSE